MSYTALYNKYRPQSFEEVAGQNAIVRTLRNAINGDKIAHAYLFCGPRGTGKTSMARLFAKALNCEEGLGHQCNHCSNCLSLMNGSHPDVIEIDAASNNGVDQVRDLIDKVRYAPIRGRYKIYIIDEVHMMSQGAFNALLKTLEEPPEHVIFILATTEPHKVIPTILSRCQRYDFSKIDDKDIREKLIWILNQENVSYEPAALDEVVTLADGGMRDALSILDQVLAFGGNSLKEEDVLAVFGLTSVEEKVKLLRDVASSDVGAVLSRLESFLSGGVDIKRLALSLLDILKDLLIYERTNNGSLLLVLSEPKAAELALIIPSRAANAMIDILLKATIDFKQVSNIRSLFELTLLQLCSLFGEEEPAPKKEAEPLRFAKAPKQEAPAPTPRVIVEPKPEPKPEPAPIPELEPEPAPTPTNVKTAVFDVKPAPKKEGYDPSSGEKYEGTVAPSFLFDNEEEGTPAPKEEPEPEPIPEAKPAPAPEPEPTPIVEESKPAPAPQPPVSKIDVSNVHAGPLKIDGDSYTLDDNTIVNIMVLGGKYKAERRALLNKWEELEPLKYDPKFGELATLLFESRPFCLCENALLLNFNHTRLKNKANIKVNQKQICELISSIVGRHVFVYALDRNDSNRCQSLYFSLQQIRKLPDIHTITLNLPKGE